MIVWDMDLMKIFVVVEKTVILIDSAKNVVLVKLEIALSKYSKKHLIDSF